MKSTILFILFGLFSIKVLAQTNLVPNPSFEEFTGCPTGLGQLYRATPWFNPHCYGIGTPDYFNQCNSTSVGVPNNGSGNEPPRTGVAYAGFYTMNLPFVKVRDYLEVPLIDTLKIGKKYVVSFYVSLAEVMGYATNKIGAYFSDTAIVNSCDTLLPYTPQIQNTYEENPLTNKNGWKLVRGTFKANGGEKYMIIGNFNTLAQSDTVYVGGGTWGNNCCSYYYIDDVSVYLDTTSGINNEDNEMFNVNIFPNPATDEITIVSSKDTPANTTFEVYDLLGNKVFSKQITSKTKQETISVSQLSEGVYLYKVKGYNKAIGNNKLFIIR